MPAAQALVIAGHGSHHDARSAAPIHAHADRIRERGCFDAVRAAFWKEQPSLAEVLDTVDAATTYVVPLMTSEGYFVDVVFPRELGLDDGRAVRYTDPVGTHPHVADVVVDRVTGVLDGAVDESAVGVALVGHGTDRHRRSALATVRQADRLRARDRFAAVEPLFLDQAPTVDDLPTAFDADDLVVVPLFVADGGHVTRDIPAALGLPSDGEPFGGPSAVGDKRVWYTGAVGTAPGLTAVILARAAEAGADVARRVAVDAALIPAEDAFLRWLEAGKPTGGGQRGRTWGELAITVSRAGSRYELRHAADAALPAADLAPLDSAAAVRDRTGTDATDDHRPLRTARTLPRGWVAAGLDRPALVRTVRAVYPASIDHWYRERTGALDSTDVDAVVARQAGRYRALDELDAETLARTMTACCGGCVRRRAWSMAAPDPPPDGEIPCPEPCSFVLEAARTFAEAPPSGPATAAAVDPSVPAAAFDRPGNRTRVRFRRAPADPDRPLPPEP